MKIVKCTQKDLKAVCDLWNEVVASEGFFKPLELNEFIEKFTKNVDFSYDGFFLAFDNEELIGYALGFLRQAYMANPESPGYLNCVVVKKEYRNQGIGKKLLDNVENYFKDNNRKYSVACNYLPLCYSWYIPNTDKHDHPCAPAVRVNSTEYFFLLHNKYAVTGFEDAFHYNLSEYELSPSINEILKENEKEGLKIEIYDPNYHYGLEEFYEDVKAPDFEKVIRANLELEKPYPFLVVNKNGKILGWTGAMWNEESGRGHFDGIVISESVRGKGMGKALFSMLAYKSKLNGAKFMTFYTGLNNHARYIYLGAGFKIIQTFSIMKKTLK